MGPKTKLLLLSSAASMIVVTATGRSAQAADIPVVKANPVDYVERCTQYGNGWIRYPGTAFCIKLAAKTGTTVDTFGRKDALVLQQNQKGNTAYSQTLVPAGQQDDFGWTTTVSFGAQTRTQTSYGTLASSSQFQFGQSSGLEGAQAKTPASSLGSGGGVTFKNSNTIFGGNISFSWGALGNIAVGRFTSENQYMAGGDWQSNSYQTGNQRTNHFYYQWNSSGSNNDPVGWTLNFSLEDPTGHGDGGQWGGTTSKGLDGCLGPGTGAPCLNGTAPNGFGGIAVTRGPFRMPDIVPNIRWLDDDIGSAFAAFSWHSIDRQAVASSPPSFGTGLGGSCGGPGIPGGIPIGACTNGTVVHAMGWANLYALHLNLPKRPGDAPYARDYILTEFAFGKGAMQEGGFQVSKRVRGGSPPFNEGGLLTDDGDAIAVALPGGGYMLEKEKFASWNFEYKRYLTSCTDPDWCWNMHFNVGLGWITPGTIAQNTDWTKGGEGKYFGQGYEFGLHYGVAELNMEVDAAVSWHSHRQDLAHDPGVAPTALPPGINKDSGTWEASLTFSRNFGGSVGKNLAGF